MASSDERAFFMKFVLVGDSGVGKTCLAARFAKGSFLQDPQPTLGLQFDRKTVIIENESVHIQLWDTAGAEKFRSMTKAYYRQSAGVFVVFDVTSRSSFQNAAQWLQYALELAETSVKVLVGNKCDLAESRVVGTAEGEDFAKQNGVAYFESSALSGERVDDMFMNAAREVLEKRPRCPPPAPPVALHVQDDGPNRRCWC